MFEKNNNVNRVAVTRTPTCTPTCTRTPPPSFSHIYTHIKHQRLQTQNAHTHTDRYTHTHTHTHTHAQTHTQAPPCVLGSQPGYKRPKAAGSAGPAQFRSVPLGSVLVLNPTPPSRWETRPPQHHAPQTTAPCVSGDLHLHVKCVCVVCVCARTSIHVSRR